MLSLAVSDASIPQSNSCTECWFGTKMQRLSHFKTCRRLKKQSNSQTGQASRRLLHTELTLSVVQSAADSGRSFALAPRSRCGHHHSATAFRAGHAMQTIVMVAAMQLTFRFSAFHLHPHPQSCWPSTMHHITNHVRSHPGSHPEFAGCYEKSSLVWKESEYTKCIGVCNRMRRLPEVRRFTCLPNHR
jgi:hypothetical protein